MSSTRAKTAGNLLHPAAGRTAHSERRRAGRRDTRRAEDATVLEAIAQLEAESFSLLRLDDLRLEYDTARSDVFGAPAHVRPEADVVLGRLTTRGGDPTDPATVEARFHEASKLVTLTRPALGPRCGFTSVAGGNPINPDQQAAKLCLVGDLAQHIWHAV